MQKIISFSIIFLIAALYFSWDSNWFQAFAFPEKHWSKEMDKTIFQIAYTDNLILEDRDSRTNNQELISSTYQDCIGMLIRTEAYIKDNYSNNLNKKNRNWYILNKEPRVNEYVSDSIDKIKRRIIGHEEWFVRILVNLNTHSVSFEHFRPLIHCQV